MRSSCGCLALWYRQAFRSQPCSGRSAMTWTSRSPSVKSAVTEVSLTQHTWYNLACRRLPYAYNVLSGYYDARLQQTIVSSTGL